MARKKKLFWAGKLVSSIRKPASQSDDRRTSDLEIEK